MIKFYFEDDYAGAKASAMVVSKAEHIDAVVSAFKVFLGLAGYHPTSIERIVMMDEHDSHQGFKFTVRGDGNPSQGDFFADGPFEGPEDGELGDDDMEHGV